MSEVGETPERGEEAADAVEAAFCEYLRVRTAGGADFEAFCGKHAALEPGLRRLMADWERVHLILERLGGPTSLADRLRSRFGEIDPGISLHDERPSPESGSVRLLDKLAARRPASTRYDIRGELGRGGMGIVYKVWDENLRRQLAMKVVLGRRDSTGRTTQVEVEPRRMSRFLEEAQITGQLDHPGILPVHELGIDPDGRVYFTMRLVEGRELREILALARKGEGEWTRTRVLGILLRVCEAMAFAHSKGVIHRDLKPANVMVGHFGAVYVMDWGLAKVLGREDSHDLRLLTSDLRAAGVATDRSESDSSPGDGIVTMDGDIIGTPAYMAPEQATGSLDDLGPRADVYSVGAILYELLTGQMPYEPLGERVPAHTILNAVRTSPPWPVLDIAPQTPPELVAICEKAMARDIAERYDDMSDFATDLRAYLEGHVVRAYETGVAAEVKKWIERNRAAAAAVAALVVVFVVGVAAFIRQQQVAVQRLGREQQNTQEALAEAEDEARRADAAVVEARANLERARTNGREADRQRGLAEANALQAQLQSAAAERKSYLAGLVAADYSLRLGEVKEAKRRLAAVSSSLRDWEWEYLAARADTSLRTYEISKSPVYFGAFVVDGCFVSVASDFWLRSIHVAEGSVDSKRTLEAGGSLAASARFVDSWPSALHPDRRHVLVAIQRGVVSIFDLEAEAEAPARTLVAPSVDRELRALDVSHDGRLVACATDDDDVLVLDYATGAVVARLAGLEGPAHAVAFHPTDSGRLAIAGPANLVRTWDHGRDLPPRVLRAHTGDVADVAWSPDGGRLASVSDDATLRLWNAETGALERTQREHTEAVTCVAYVLVDGEPRILTGSRDTTVRLWDPADGSVLDVFPGHEGAVLDVALEPGGQRFLSTSADGTARLWPLGLRVGAEEHSVRVDGAVTTRVVAADFDRSGERMLVAMDYASIQEATQALASTGAVEVLDRVTREVTSRYETDSKIVSAAFVEDGSEFVVLLAPSANPLLLARSSVVGGAPLRSVRAVLVSASSGRVVRELPLGDSRELYALAVDPRGERVAVGGLDDEVLVLDVASGELVRRLEGHAKSISALAFSADGRILASGSRDRTVRVWSLQTGEVLRVLRGHAWQITALAFDGEGQLLASGSSDRTVRIWDLVSGETRVVLEDHEGVVSALEFSRTGRRLLTGCTDTFVRVFEADSGDVLLRLTGHTGGVRALALSPDGETILSTADDGTFRLWESRSARERWEELSAREERR